MVIPLRWMTEQFENYGYIELFERLKRILSVIFIHVEEVVKWTIKAMESRQSGIYNVGTDKERSYYDMAVEHIRRGI